MQRLGGRIEPGGFGKPEVHLMSAGHKEGEAGSYPDCQAEGCVFIVRT